MNTKIYNNIFRAVRSFGRWFSGGVAKVLAVCAIFALTGTAWALTKTVDGITWTYTVSGGKAKIGTGGKAAAISTDTVGDVYVPSMLDGYPVETIGSWAFYGCNYLREVRLPGTLVTIEDNALRECSIESVFIPPSVTSIGANAFFKTALESVSITYYSVTYIGESAFASCSSLVTAEIKADTSMTSLPAQLFKDCTSLESVNIAFCNVTTIGMNTFSGCTSLERVDMPDVLTNISEGAFRGCSALREFWMPDGVTSIASDAFGDAALETVYVSKGKTGAIKAAGLNPAAGGFKIVEIGAVTSWYDSDAGVTWYYRPIGEADGVKEAELFKDGDCAVDPVPAAAIAIPAKIDGLTVTRIGDYAFNFCDTMPKVTIPPAVTRIGDYAFSGCALLSEVDIPDGVTAIGTAAFSECDSLKDVVIPGSVATIGDSVFYNCDKLETATFGEGVRKIGTGTFTYCYALKDVVIPGSLREIGAGTFDYCTKLENVEIGDGVTRIGDNAFNYCTALKSIAIPNSVTLIGIMAFYECDALQSVVVPDGVTRIGEEAFYGCDDLESVAIPGSVTYIGKNAFDSTPKLKTVYVANGQKDGVKGLLATSGLDTSGISLAERFTVAFDRNDGEGLLFSRLAIDGVVGELPTPTQPGYTLLGWFTAAGDQINDSTAVTADTTYYAYWHADLDVFTVTFNANGGTCAEATREVEDGSAVGMLPSAVRDGFTFGGWFTAADGGIAVDAATVVTADVTFYAHWVSPQIWFTTRAEALAEAIRTGKKIFLVCGRDTCYNTMTTKNVSCEDPLVKDELAAKCVLWYSNCDTQDEENRYYRYGLGSYTLPLVCIIDPKDPDHYVKRATGGDYGGPLSAADVRAFIADVPYPETSGSATSGSTTSGSSGYVFLDTNDVTMPYSAAKTLYGALYNGSDIVGVMELKLGRMNVRKGTSRVSGSVTLLDGKRYNIKGVQVIVSGSVPLSVSLEVKKVGTMAVTIGGDRFAGTLGRWHVQSANVGGNWKSSPTVSVDIGDLSAIPGTVLDSLLPTAEKGVSSGIRWTFPKATSVKWAKPKYGEEPVTLDAASGKGLIVDKTKGRTNLSGMKLTYMAKKGTFKGSFKVYALEGSGAATKLKKYTVKVGGVVVDGVGYGSATCKRPAFTWSLTVR